MAFPNSHWFVLSSRPCSPESEALRTFVCLRTSLARMYVKFHPWPCYCSLGSSVVFSAYTVRSSPLSALYFLRYEIRLPKPPSPFHESSHYRNTHHLLRHLRGSIRAMTLLPPRAQPCQFSNAQLRARRRRACPYLHPRILSHKRAQVVKQIAAQSSMRVDCVSTTGKWLLAQRVNGRQVAEPVVMSKKRSSWRGARVLERAS
jgi:hypothetical protein